MQYACMRCTPGELRRCLFGTRRPRCPNTIFVVFVRDSLSHDSRRFAFRLAAEPFFGSALFFTQPCGLRCARSRRSSLFLRAAFFWRLSNRRPAMHFLAGDSTLFLWSLAQDHFRCWTCPGAFPGRVRRRRGRTARAFGLTLFFRKRLPVECFSCCLLAMLFTPSSYELVTTIRLRFKPSSLHFHLDKTPLLQRNLPPAFHREATEIAPKIASFGHNPPYLFLARLSMRCAFEEMRGAEYAQAPRRRARRSDRHRTDDRLNVASQQHDRLPRRSQCNGCFEHP